VTDIIIYVLHLYAPNYHHQVLPMLARKNPRDGAGLRTCW